MQKMLGYRILSILAVLMFGCLFLNGGSRLIAAPQEEAGPIHLASSWMDASLSCLPSSQVQSLQATGQEENKTAAAVPVFFEPMVCDAHAPQTDANGNILGTASYMRAVYQVFALGDGFV